MAAGDLTCTLVGSYATIALAIAAIDAETLASATDTIQIIQVAGGDATATFKVVKTVRATA